MNERANKWKASIKRPAKILGLEEFKVKSPNCQANVHYHNEGSCSLSKPHKVPRGPGLRQDPLTLEACDTLTSSQCWVST